MNKRLIEVFDFPNSEKTNPIEPNFEKTKIPVFSPKTHIRNCVATVSP